MWLTPSVCRVSDLAAIVDSVTSLPPFASAVESNVPIYDAASLPSPREIMAEWSRVLLDGPGIVVIRGAFPDPDVINRATAEFNAMIASQPAGGDHFAKAGANDRVWNALEKLALRAPDVFTAYYANEVLALAARAWLGPGYQVTSQVNVVNPGGVAQTGHRDYHLGFMSAAQAAEYPASVHRLSPLLTLQGAVAHCDMPVESGPTMYLPHSQKYEPGYLAVTQPEFASYFTSHAVQLPLRKGDAVFFNPALIHAAGENRSPDVRRMANLLQISSAFGRAMESVDRRRMCEAVFPSLLKAEGVDNVIAATAEGYPFPTNLDSDQPVGGLAPPSQADVLRAAVAGAWSPAELHDALAAHAERRR